MTPRSCWQLALGPAAAPDAVPLPGAAGTVVVGGGVIGAACAYALARRGADVTLVEAFAPATGASGRSGGFVVGSARELDALRDVLAREEIDAGYEEPGHLALATSEAVLDAFSAGAEERPPGAVEILDRAGCEERLGRRVSGRFAGGRWQPRAGLLDPVRLVRGLTAAAVRRGATFVDGCAAKRIVPVGDDGGATVETALGRIEADRVVVACGAATGALVPSVAGLLRARTGRMLVTEPGPPAFSVGMAIDFGAVYWRQRGDGSIVIGGSGDLERALPDAFPGFPAVAAAHRWEGVMDETPDGRPLLGRADEEEAEVWVAAGFGGHGIPPALHAGEALALAIADGRPPAVLDRLAPGRLREAVLS